MRSNPTSDVCPASEVVLAADVPEDEVRTALAVAGFRDGCAQHAEAVRQWRFSPARRLSAPVDVIAEVSVEFKFR